MLQLHHLHGRPVAASDLRRQFLPEDRHLFAIRSANMRRQVSRNAVFTALRSKPNQVGKLAGREPREPAAVIDPTECQAPVASMPCQPSSAASSGSPAMDFTG